MRVRHMLGVVESARRKKLIELRRDGFEILEADQIVDLIGRGRPLPDLVARRNDEVVIVEFAKKESGSALSENAKKSLLEFSEIADSHPNWQFEVFWIGEDATVPPERSVDDFARRAVRLADLDPLAGLLVGWAALEGAIARLAERTSELGEVVKRGSRPGLAQLASLGLLSGDDFSELNNIRQIRNSVAHGIDTHVEPDTVRRLASIAEKLADSNYLSADEMVDWFFENFEDPANGVPYDSGEGGYQYVLDGPHNADDVLTDQFPEASREDIDEAVRVIENDGYEWVRRGIY
jgi:hypothetical protein